MKIYQMDGDCNNYWFLDLRRISAPIRDKMSDGVSVAAEWVEIGGRWETDGRLKGDFASTDKSETPIAMSEHALSILRPLLHGGCETLPVMIDGERFWCLYLLTPDDPLDWTMSVVFESYRTTLDDLHTTSYPAGIAVQKPVFKKELIGNRHLFRLRQGMLYFVSSAFKMAIDRAGLKGVTFYPVWTDEADEFSNEPVGSTIAPHAISDADRRRIAQTKRGQLLLALWERVIDPLGHVVWIEGALMTQTEVEQERQASLSQFLLSTVSRGLPKEELARWARGMGYSVVFAVLVTLDELGAYSRASLSGLAIELAPGCRVASKKRRKTVAERLWTDAVEYFQSDEWWSDELLLSGQRSADFCFLTDVSRVMSDSLRLGVSESDWKAAAHVFAFHIVRETLTLIDDLNAFGAAALEGLHESLLMSNPRGTA